jgi:hypothetical protein
MKQFTVKKGRHNFSPRIPLHIRRGVTGFHQAFVFDSSCWYDTKAVGDHWNKLLGVTSAFSWNDRDACMAAWRPMPERGMFSVAAYANFPGKARSWRVLGEAEAGEHCELDCFFDKPEGLATFEYKDMQARLDFDAPNRIRQVGMWLGGQPKAPHDMKITANIWFFS